MKSELTPYFLDEAIVVATIARLNEDLKPFNVEIQYSGTEKSAYHQILAQLIPVIFELNKSHKNKLMQLLYKVDISEYVIRKARKESAEKSLEEILSVLILNREAQKVITRILYKEKEIKKNSDPH